MGIAALIVGATLAAAPVQPAATGRLALYWDDAQDRGRLATVDPLTGFVHHPSLRLPIGTLVEDYAPPRAVFSPSRRLLGLSTEYCGRVTVVDLVRWRILRSVGLGLRCRPANGPFPDVKLLSWPRPNRLIVTTGFPRGLYYGAERLRVVDRADGRTLAQRSLGYVIDRAAGPHGEAVLLTTRTHGDPAARIVSVDRRLRIRSVRLPAITVTLAQGQSVDHARPALAVDFAHRHAYVLPARGPVAVVDLRTRAVTLRQLARPGLDSELGPTGEPVSFNGPAASAGTSRTAQWIGAGRIAVSGTDSAAVTGGQADTPAGLRFVNTRNWTVRLADRRPTSFLVDSGRLLSPIGSTVVVYDRTGRVRARYAGRPFSNTGRVYRLRSAFYNDRPELATISNLRTGRRLGRKRISVHAYDMFRWRRPD